MKLFIDTGAFYSSKDISDKYHIDADKYFEIIRIEPRYQLVTSNFIIDETITLIRMKINHSAAVSFGNQIKASKLIRIIHVTDKIEEQAWKIFEQYDDKDFSFTDCTSFAIMENENIQNAFTFDRHFTQYGFQIHPPIKLD